MLKQKCFYGGGIETCKKPKSKEKIEVWNLTKTTKN